MTGERPGGPVALDLGGTGHTRRTGRYVMVGGAGIAVLVGLAVGLLAVGLLAGWLPGLIVCLALGLPFVALGMGEWRRHIWLDGTTVYQRGLGVRRVDIATAERLELAVADLRRRRTIALMAAGPPRDKAVSVPIAAYSGEAGAELDILALRRLADVLASAQHSSGLVQSELLVAQLRAEARGEGPEGRPMYQLANTVAAGRVPRRVGTDVLVRFVGQLP